MSYPHFALVEVTPPGIEPIGLQEAKDHLRMTRTDQDAIVDALIGVARRRAESETGRALITQTWDLLLDSFPVEIWLPKAPLQTVDQVSYIDTAGDSQTLDAADYQLDGASVPARLKPVYGATWPTTRAGDYAAVTVRFTAGYGAGVADVPGPIKQAMLLMIAELYQRSEHSIVGAAVNPVPLNAQWALAPYRVLRFV